MIKIILAASLVLGFGTSGCTPVQLAAAGQDAKRITFDDFVLRATLRHGQRLEYDNEVWEIVKAGIEACLDEAEKSGWAPEKYESCLSFAKSNQPELVITSLIKEGVLTRNQVNEMLGVSSDAE